MERGEIKGIEVQSPRSAEVLTGASGQAVLDGYMFQTWGWVVTGCSSLAGDIVKIQRGCMYWVSDACIISTAFHCFPGRYDTVDLQF